MEKGEIIDSLNNDLRAELSAVEIYTAHAEAIQEDEKVPFRLTIFL